MDSYYILSHDSSFYFIIYKYIPLYPMISHEWTWSILDTPPKKKDSGERR